MPTNSTDMTEHDDGTVTLHDKPGGIDGDWHVHKTSDGLWTADNTEQGFLRSRINGAFRATYHTRDEVLAALGVPQVSA